LQLALVVFPGQAQGAFLLFDQAELQASAGELDLGAGAQGAFLGTQTGLAVGFGYRASTMGGVGWLPSGLFVNQIPSQRDSSAFQYHPPWSSGGGWVGLVATPFRIGT
jgi:hypothetical protein